MVGMIAWRSETKSFWYPQNFLPLALSYQLLSLLAWIGFICFPLIVRLAEHMWMTAWCPFMTLVESALRVNQQRDPAWPWSSCWNGWFNQWLPWPSVPSPSGAIAASHVKRIFISDKWWWLGLENSCTAFDSEQQVHALKLTACRFTSIIACEYWVLSHH